MYMLHLRSHPPASRRAQLVNPQPRARGKRGRALRAGAARGAAQAGLWPQRCCLMWNRRTGADAGAWNDLRLGGARDCSVVHACGEAHAGGAQARAAAASRAGSVACSRRNQPQATRAQARPVEAPRPRRAAQAPGSVRRSSARPCDQKWGPRGPAVSINQGTCGQGMHQWRWARPPARPPASRLP